MRRLLSQCLKSGEMCIHSTSHGIVTPASESLISAGGAEHAAQKYNGLENGQLDSSGPKEEISQDNVGALAKNQSH